VTARRTKRKLDLESHAHSRPHTCTHPFACSLKEGSLILFALSCTEEFRNN